MLNVDIGLFYALKLYVLYVFAGETGIGKSTLIDTLFNTHFDSSPSTHDLPGVKLKGHTYGKYHSFDIRISIACVQNHFIASFTFGLA